MLTIEKLREYGADVDDGLVRCMNKKEFYLMLVNKAKEDTMLSRLEQQINDNDLISAFETAHALKGIYANLSLTPLTEPISDITELLRNGTDTDYSVLMNEAKKEFQKLCSL